MLYARHLGLKNADRLPTYKSYKFLNITPYPETILEASQQTQEIADKHNKNVIEVREKLKEVIKTMERTKLVKSKILNLLKPDLSPSPQNYWDERILDKILEKYNL